MRVLTVAAVLGIAIAGHALAGVSNPLGAEQPPGVEQLLGAIGSAQLRGAPETRFCFGPLPGLGTTGCAGVDRVDGGPPCAGTDATEEAVHLVYGDAAVNEHRVGVFLYCADFIEPNGPGTKTYYSAALAGVVDDHATPGPMVLWYEQGGIDSPGADPFYICFIEVYLEPVGLLSSQPCLAGPPPHPPALPV